MRRYGFIALAASLLAVYGPSAAADGFPEGFYGSLNLGIAEVDTSPCEVLTGPSQFDCDDSDFAIGLVAGWQIFRWLGVEAGYLDLGKTSVNAGATEISAEVDGFTLAVTGTVPIMERAGLFGRVGTYFWDGELKGQLSDGMQSLQVNESDDDSSLFWGFGFRFPFTESFGIGIQYDSYLDIGNDDVFEAGETDVNVISASFIWDF